MSNTNVTTTTTTAQPANGLLAWAEHCQAVWQATDASIGNRLFLAEHGYDVDPSEVFASALSDLRSGLVEPIVRLTSEQMDELERERPGAEFCETPYLY